MKRHCFCPLVLTALFAVGAKPAEAGPFVAFSLREAALQAQHSPRASDLLNLGGITRVCGMVYDAASDDLILVGRVVAGQAPASLDDLVVALRARLLLNQWPTVSIDPTAETRRTGFQAVTFLGGIENTAFGRDLLQSDIVLKEGSLQLRQLVAPVVSYRAQYAQNLLEALRRKGLAPVDTEIEWFDPASRDAAFEPLQGRQVKEEQSHHCRFWFYPCEPPYFLVRDGVFCIQELRLAVQEELIERPTDPAGAAKPSPEAAEAARQFADSVSKHLGPLSKIQPVLKRLKILYDLVAVAEGVRELGRPSALAYLLEQYPIGRVETAHEHGLVRLCALIKRTDGLQQAVELSGGVQLKTDLRWLNMGEVGRLRQVVLKARPDPRALTWVLPLDDWRMPNAQDLDGDALSQRLAPTRPVRGSGADAGCSMGVLSYLVDPSRRALPDALRAFRGFDLSASWTSAFSPVAPRLNLNGVLIDPKVVRDAQPLRRDGSKTTVQPFAPGAKPVQKSNVPVQAIEDPEFQKRRRR